MTALRDIPAAILQRLRAWGSGWLRRFDPGRDDDEDEPFPTDRTRRRSSSTSRRPTSLFNAPQPVLPPPPAVSSIPHPAGAPVEPDAAAEAPVEARVEPTHPFSDEPEMEQIHVELSGEGRLVSPEERTARAQDANSTEIMDPVPTRKPPLRRSVTERTAKKDTEITARMPKRATARLQRLSAPPDAAQLAALKAQKDPPPAPAAPQHRATTERRRRVNPSDVISWPGEAPAPPVPTDRFQRAEPPGLPPLPSNGRPGIGEPSPPPDEDELGDRSMNHLYNQRHDPT